MNLYIVICFRKMILCQVISFYLINMDITEHKRLTAELQTSYDKLEERVEARTAELRDALAISIFFSDHGGRPHNLPHGA